MEQLRTTPTAYPSEAQPRLNLDKRESAQVTHALAYSANYAAAGEPGHSHLMLIAKLSQALGLAQPKMGTGR